MDLSDAVGLLGIAAMLLLIAAGFLAIAAAIADKCNAAALAALMRRLIKIALLFSLVGWILAGMLMFAAMSQSDH